MVATFILTRAFAISALFIGAFPIADAAPVPAPSVLDTVLIFASRLKHEHATVSAGPPGLYAQAAPVTKRSCRQAGCLKREDEAETVAYYGHAILAEVLDSVESVASDLGAEEAQQDEKRSCRQVGCLRELVANIAPPSIDAFAREPADAIAESADAARRSCRQPGCLRELPEDDATAAEADTAALVSEILAGEDASDTIVEARGCRQDGCLGSVDSREALTDFA